MKSADLVAVVEDERIVELGPREELLAKNGAFARLWAAQNLSME